MAENQSPKDNNHNPGVSSPDRKKKSTREILLYLVTFRWFSPFLRWVENIPVVGFFLTVVLAMAAVFVVAMAVYLPALWLYRLHPVAGFLAIFGVISGPLYFFTKKRWVFWVYIVIISIVFFGFFLPSL